MEEHPVFSTVFCWKTITYTASLVALSRYV
jgi:hypothetical protein